jgi:hypothetical protein
MMLSAFLVGEDAWSQNSDIRGIVSDSLTGQRIPLANVTILNTTRGASANNAGFYLIPSVPPGEYDVAAAVLGYRSTVLHVRVFPGKMAELNFRLASVPVEESEVVITAPRKREVLEINTSVHVLERRELKAAPVLTQEDVFHALKSLPGVVSTSDVSSKFYVRGGGGDQNLVLFDGIKIYNPFHGLGIFSLFDPDIVQSVEMYTGAFPAGFGGRLSSVINMATRDGRGDKLAGAANLNFLSTKLLLEGPAYEGSSWIINGRKSLFSKTFKRIVGQDLPVSFFDFFSKFTHQFRQGTKVDLIYLSSGDGLRFGGIDEPDYHWRSNSFGLTASHLIGDRLFVNLVAYTTFYHAERDVKSSTVATPSSSLVQEPGLRATASYTTDDQNLLFFGFEFSFPTFEYRLTNTFGSLIDIEDSFPDATTWFRYQARFDRLRLDGGVHVDLSSIMEREAGIEAMQPRLNVSYLLSGNWRAKLSLGTYNQRAITLTNEDDIISIFDPWVKIPSQLRPERAVHTVLGIDGNLIESLSFGIQGYHKKYLSLVVYNQDKVDATQSDYIAGSGASYGAEVLFRCTLSSVDLYASYSLGWTSLENNGLAYYPRYDRRHHLNILGTARLAEGLDVSVRWEFGTGFPFTQSLGFYDRLRFVNSMPGPYEFETGEPYLALGGKNAARLPSYHRLDISLSYKLNLPGGLRASVGVQVINAYDSKNVLYFDRKTGERVNMLPFFPSVSMTVSR